MRPTSYLVYGMLLLSAASWAEYKGWTLTRVDEVKDVPKTVRNNPGAYRSHYAYIPRYVGGK